MADEALLRIEISNSKPVELIDLTTSLMALAEAFEDYASESTADPLPGNLRLYVHELRSGSIVANLQTLADQAQWLADHGEVLAGFVGNLDQIIQYFLGGQAPGANQPSRREAERISQIVEPVAKDFGSQMNIQVSGGDVHIHQHIHVEPQAANALQNSVRRFLGPSTPAREVRHGEMMVLEQVKNSARTKTGDRGVIETISRRPVKLQFSSDEAKRRVLDMDGNPFLHIFVVDVEVNSSEGKPALYRVLAVNEVLERPD